jgi:hypothetical protein
MKKIIYSLFLLAIVSSCGQEEKKETVQKEETASQMYFNGEILTMETDEVVYVEAVVEQEGKIVFVGSQKDAEEKYGNATKIDLKGKTMLPGFIDPHSHFGMVSNTMGQVDLNPAPVGDVNNIPAMMEKMKQYKADNNIPDGEWIYGWGYDDGQLEEKRHPNKKELDAVLPNNPVYLQHTSGHMGVANSKALEVFEVTADSKNPDGGNIERFPNSTEPTGLVQETAMYPFVEKMMGVMAAAQAEHFGTTQDYYAANGITTAHDGMTGRSTIQFYQDQADAGKMKIDLVVLAGYSELDDNINDSTLVFKEYKNGFKTQGTKIVADGSPQGKTAFFTKPFLTEVPGCAHQCRGLPSLSQEAIDKLFLTAYDNNNQLFIHCNGDATVDMILTAHENACEELNHPLNKDRRTIIIHAQFSRQDQLEKFVEYNMQPSFFTNHAYFWGDVHVENLGKERADFLSPMATSIKMGLKPTNHSDATVTPIDPIFTIWSAVNRISRSGAIIGENERVTPYQAIQAITSNAAYELFDKDLKGTLTKGKLADFVILDKNPLKVEAGSIKDIQVVETVKEGKSVYLRE